MKLLDTVILPLFLLLTIGLDHALGATSKLNLRGRNLQNQECPSGCNDALFDITLTGYTGSKIAAIQAVKEATGVGLASAKTIVESVPYKVLEAGTRDRTNEVKTILQGASTTFDVFGDNNCPLDCTPAPPATNTPPPPSTGDLWDVILTDGGANKLDVVEVVRQLAPSLGEKEAKEFVESVPKAIKEAVSCAVAIDAAQKLQAVGATVQVAGGEGTCDPGSTGSGTGGGNNDHSGSMSMDPHVQKWDGTWYDYNGQCDLVLLKEPTLGIEIHVRTTIRYSYSYVEATAIRIGDDILEIGGWGEYIWNGVDGALATNKHDIPTSTMGGYPIHYTQVSTKKHKFVIPVDKHGHNITIATFKDFVNVNVHMENLYDSSGLMGDFATGASLARDGTTVLDDPNQFGQEWQVLETEPKLFVASRAPQAPQEKCLLPDKKQRAKNMKKQQNNNSSLHKAAEEVCRQWAHQNRDACIMDIVATGDLDLAQAEVF